MARAKCIQSPIVALICATVLAASAFAAEPRVEKAPVPTQEEQDKAWKVVRSVYQEKFKAAADAGARTKLAYEVLHEAQDNTGDQPAYFVLLQLARNLAVMADDLDLAITAIGAADDAFQVDAQGMRIAAFEELAPKYAAAKKSRIIVLYEIFFAEQALASGDTKSVRRLMKLAIDVAEDSKDGPLVQRVQERNRLIESEIASKEQQESLRRAVGEKRESLRKDPTDPKANFAVGQIESLVDGDWTKGLPHLARGEDPKWKDLAERELNGPTLPVEQAALADGWYELSSTEKGPSREALLRHATVWYRKSLPDLRGIRNRLTKEHVEKRLAEIEKPEIPPQAPMRPRGPFLDSDSPFASRASGNRRIMSLRYGGTPATDRAVAAALYWLAKHQMPEGNWSLQGYTTMCKDKTCTGAGSLESLSAATALGLLPLLAIGQTQSSKGPFQKTIASGVYWLVSHQKADGDLSADALSQMYSHGLATIALCEDYGLSHDRTVGKSAQKAVNFIQAAQNTKTGGWRYHPGEEGDTSVVGWQLMALKSAQMAGLTVENINPTTFERTKRWLNSVAKDGGRFSYQPDGNPTAAMSAVGLLCSQSLGSGRDDLTMVGGVRYLMANLPGTPTALAENGLAAVAHGPANGDSSNGRFDISTGQMRNGSNMQNIAGGLPESGARDVYYWYYATQVMHNMADKDWDTWNRKMRTILVGSQIREGCASGSWDPEKPSRDAWAPYGGRLMLTSLSALTLEVYYRYMPIYDQNDAKPAKQLPQ